jgi:hypothetical protein
VWNLFNFFFYNYFAMLNWFMTNQCRLGVISSMVNFQITRLKLLVWLINRYWMILSIVLLRSASNTLPNTHISTHSSIGYHFIWVP